MPYTFKYDPETNCIYAAMEGEIDKDLVKKLLAEIKPVIKENNCIRILNDLSKATLKDPLSNIWEFPKVIAKSGLARNTRRALVYSDNEIAYQFFETAARIQGHNIRAFSNYDDAKRWVLSNAD